VAWLATAAYSPDSTRQVFDTLVSASVKIALGVASRRRKISQSTDTARMHGE
jgi:hypothetical protein